MPHEKRTYADRREYLIQAVSRRRQKLKEMAVRLKGGRCQFCGYHKYLGALDFHHINPQKKDFNLSLNGLTRSWKKIQDEIDKCVLVCANCHREIHGEMLQPSSVMKIGNTG